jgi:mono/diheme cytochrome c family protein
VVKQPDLASMTVAQLLQQLKSPERWTRYQAKRLLFDKLDDPNSRREIEMGAGSAIMATQVKGAASPLAIDKELIGMAGLLDAIGHGSSTSADILTTDASFHVRAIAARGVPAWASEQGSRLIPALAQDEHPRVRLEALVSAVNHLTPTEAFSIFLEVARQPRDRFLDYALTNAARVLRPYWQPLAAQGGLNVEPEILTFLQNAAGKHEEKPPGQIVFENLCLNCHQPDGNGLPGIYPPIAKSEWVTRDADRLIEIIIRGAQGRITVNGKPFNNIMPPSGLDDQRIADVLTYVRSHFGNAAAPINPEQVQNIRKKLPEGSGLWSEEK